VEAIRFRALNSILNLLTYDSSEEASRSPRNALPGPITAPSRSSSFTKRAWSSMGQVDRFGACAQVVAHFSEGWAARRFP